MAVGTSRIGMRVLHGIGRALPETAAARAIDLIASRMLASGSETVRASRVNQYVVSGGTLSGEALDAAVRDNVRNMARFLYDLYHVLGNDPAEDAIMVHDEVFESFLERDRTQGPFVYVGAHMGNFDLVGRALARAGWHLQVLSVPEPHGGYQWQNEVREQAGFELTPVSAESMKEALRRLEAGRSVLTGHDRPLDAPDKVQPRFFGHPAPLPLLHVRLAMHVGVPVIALTGRLRSDGRYELLASDPVPIAAERATPEKLLANAEACLASVEGWIAAAPDQWAMPHVVWPDVTAPD